MCTHCDCSFINSDGYCMVTACVNPNYNASGTYIVDKFGKYVKCDNQRKGTVILTQEVLNIMKIKAIFNRCNL